MQMTSDRSGLREHDEAYIRLPDRPASEFADATLRRMRHTLLAGLPIAVAATALDAHGDVVAVDHNALFSGLEACSPAGTILAQPAITQRIQGFLTSTDTTFDFDWIDGDALCGRHFTVRLARLTAAAPHEHRCLVSMLERTAEVETHRSLRAELLHDSLTGLPNRAAFEEAVDEAVDAAAALPADAASGVRTAVMVVDLARFSRINECMGSLIGDELIITFARRLLGTVRGEDRLARIGGDEFGVLFSVKHGEPDVRDAATRIQRALSAPFVLSDVEIRVECAIGCALAGVGPVSAGNPPEDLIRNAQLALKRAKESGTVEVYQRGEVAAVHRRFSIETELRRAIEGDRLTLAWQPVIDLESGGVAGFEALARWTHPDQGVISPVEFIPVAEESGLIVPLGRWALDAALRTLAGWDWLAGTRLPVSIAVNVSPLQLARDDMPAQIGTALAAHAIDGGRLTVELTESAIVRDPERAMRVLGQLADHAVTVAMDDFGTGYSSLAYLQKLPIDVLKIDRSFVTPMLADRDSVAIVRAILNLAKSLGMRTTAEGVETHQLAQTLAALGCSYGQGYHFARPLSPEAAYAYWRDARA